MPVGTITLERGSYVDTYVSGLKEPHDRNNGVRGGVAKCLAYISKIWKTCFVVVAPTN